MKETRKIDSPAVSGVQKPNFILDPCSVAARTACDLLLRRPHAWQFFWHFFINLAETCKCFPEEWFITMLLGCIQSSTNLPNVWTARAAWNSSPHLASSCSLLFIRLSIDFNCWGAGGGGGGWALRDGWCAGSDAWSHLYLFGVYKCKRGFIRPNNNSPSWWWMECDYLRGQPALKVRRYLYSSSVHLDPCTLAIGDVHSWQKQPICSVIIQFISEYLCQRPTLLLNLLVGDNCFLSLSLIWWIENDMVGVEGVYIYSKIIKQYLIRWVIIKKNTLGVSYWRKCFVVLSFLSNMSAPSCLIYKLFCNLVLKIDFWDGAGYAARRATIW